VDLDLNVTSRAAATSSFSEGFEGGFGNWVLDPIDDGKATNALSDGYRCAYADPDDPGNPTHGETECAPRS
jgi:hypothetical protein